jgi:hypothetical protein
MRASMLIALASVVCCSAAEPILPVVLYETTDAQGRRLQYRTDTKILWDTPQSGLGPEEQPLSMKDACKIANDAGMRQFPKAEGLSWLSLKFLKNNFDYSYGRIVTWFYVISVAPVFHVGSYYTTGPPIEIVILLSGKVLEPSIVK